MSRRLRRCLACKPQVYKFGRTGFTRHDDQVCARCRSRGVTHRDGTLTVPIELAWPTHSPDECLVGCTEHYPGRYA